MSANLGVILTETGAAAAGSWSDHITLLLSFILFMLSFFLLAESIRTLRWRIPEAPHADSGALLAVITACIILSVWVLRLFVVNKVAPEATSLMNFLFGRSGEIASGFLLASFAPIGVALFKLLTVVAAGPHPVEGMETARRPLLVVWLQTGFVVVVALVSMVLLIHSHH